MHWADRRASVAVPNSLSDARMAGIGASGQRPFAIGVSSVPPREPTTTDNAVINSQIGQIGAEFLGEALSMYRWRITATSTRGGRPLPSCQAKHPPVARSWPAQRQPLRRS